MVGALAAGLSMPANLGRRMKFWSRVIMVTAGAAFALSAAAAYAAPTPPPPSSPRNLKATAGDSQVTLSWSPPSTGAPITTYEVITAPADVPQKYTSSTSLLVTGLTNGTTYSFAVRAANASGYGPSARTTAIPHVIPPSAPTNLAATSGPGASQITLSWTPPTSNGSSPTIDHYTVISSPGGGSAQTDGQTTTYVASNIADNVTYTFTVSATNSKNATGPVARVYAPLPIGATIGLQPTAGAANSLITVTGQAFLKNESITLYWDVPADVATSVVTDGNGSFTKVVKPFAGDKPNVHKLCASVPPTPCANFTLQPPPSPTPSAAPSPSPVESPSPSPSPANPPPASGARTGGGPSGFDIITKPPFVFLPIIGILGLLGVIAYWALSRRRRTYTPTAATVVHRATRPDYMAPVPTPVPAPVAAPQPPVVPPLQPPAQPPLPVAGPPPVQPPPAPPPPAPTEPPPTIWPAAPDEPPDLPEPSD